MSTNFLQTTTGSISWATAANWSGLAVPVNSDDTTVGQGSATLDLGLNQAAVTLASLKVPMTFTGTCGLAAQTTASVTSITRSSGTATVTQTTHGYATGDTVVISGAVETDYNGTYTITVTGASTYTYTVANSPSTPATGTIIARRYDYLRIGATAFRYGDPGSGATTGAGSGRFKADFTTIQTTATIISTKASGSDSGLEPVRLLGSHASNSLTVLAGLVGSATTTPAETAVWLNSFVNGGTLNFGAGVTWTNVYQTGGTFNAAGSVAGTTALFQQSGGTATLNGTGTITNMILASTTKFNLRKATAGDTVTGTLQLFGGAVLDLTGNPATLSVGTLRISGEDVQIKRNPSNPGHFSWTTLTQDTGSSFRFI